MVDIILDASHGGYDNGSIGFLGLKEKDCTLYIAKVCKEILEKKGISVKLTRNSDEAFSGEDRSKIVKAEGCKCFITIHTNSSDDRRECGTEVVCGTDNIEADKLAYDLISAISTTSKLNSRGIKHTDLILFKEVEVPAAMINVCFLTNEREEKLLLNKDFNIEIASLIAEGVEQYLSIQKEDLSNELKDTEIIEFNEEDNSLDQIEDTPDLGAEIKDTLTKIIGGDIPDKNQAKQWAKNNGATDEFIELADLYWSLYKDRGNVNPAIAYSQAAIESNNGKFDLQLSLSCFNPCGLKDEKIDGYKKFKSWNEGVEAHLDHLALYAGANGYPNKESKDTRHFSYLLGVCKYVENLSGKWSSDPEYGINILKVYYDILSTKNKDVFRESIKNIDGFKTQIGEFKNKVVVMGKTLEEVCKEYNQIYKSLENLKEEIANLEEDKKILELDKKSLETKNQLLAKNVVEHKRVLKDIVKIIGASVEKSN